MTTKQRTTLFVAITLIALFILSACGPTAAPVTVGDGNTTNVTNNVTINNVNVEGTGNNVNVGNDVEIEEAPAPAAATDAPVVAEATEAPTSNEDWSLLVGGRNDDEGDYFMYQAEIATSLLEDGTALQQYLNQVAPEGFDNTLNLKEYLEIFNDGVKIVVTHGRAYFMPTDGDVPHSTISWIQYVPEKGILICHDDDGEAGSWVGDCAGKTQWVTESISLEELLSSGKFQPWAESFAHVENQLDGNIFNGKIELLEVHR